MFRNLTICFAALITTVAFTSVASASAEAAPIRGLTAVTLQLTPEIAVGPADVQPLLTCAAGDLCFWVNADYLGARGRFAGNNAHWSDFPQPQCPDGNWNDCASSAVNRGTQCTVHLHQNSSYGGDQISIGRGGNRPHLSANGFNDKTSSNSWC